MPDLIGTCAVANGGCSPDAFCMDIGGVAACVCTPGYTGTGQACNACTVCGTSEFMTAPCTPTTDTVCNACTTCGSGDFTSTACSATADAICSTCTASCLDTNYASQACGGTSDLVCTPCSQCSVGQYVDMLCSGSMNTSCAPCAQGCELCGGPGPTCFQCEVGLVLSQGMCLPRVCGNGSIEPGEVCDDGDMTAGDGCSDQCMVEVGYYCFGEVLSTCRAGACVSDALTALPVGADFVLDGAGTVSAAGIRFSQRSTIRTSADVAYPILIEADVVYSGTDVTFIGARGPGTRDAGNANEPTDTLRGRFTQSTGLAQLVSGINDLIASDPGFIPQIGVPYRVRYVDDGLAVGIELFNLTNLAQGVFVPTQSSFHGSGDRAFVGGGDQGGVTMSNLRICSAPVLPVTTGLAARYSAIPSWTVPRNTFDVTQWLDISGNANHLTPSGLAPIFGGGFINAMRPGVSFAGAARLVSAPFALTTDVTVFAVIHHNTPSAWGAIAHHGSRDNDWSMEQNSFSGDPNTLHWQTANDNANVDITVTSNTDYILTGRISGTARYFSATAFSGTSPALATFTDTVQTISAGSKILYVGASDQNEASNAQIGDLIYFTRALTDVERDAVIEYLRRLWQP